MSTDPAPLLSTIAGSSAGLVAIVGGLLVARFVTLDSEQQGAQRILDDAEARLAVAKQRAQEDSEQLLRWDARDFLYDSEVLTAINEGVEEPDELRQRGDRTRLTDEELQPFVEDVRGELARAHQTLEEAIPAVDPKYQAYGGWEDFQRDTPGLPETDWDLAWSVVFTQIIEQRPRTPSRSFLPSSPLGRIPRVRLSSTDWEAIRARRRDELLASQERAAQQVEDLEGEVLRLQQARDALVRPQGLGLGLVILGYFTVVGVVLPVLLMSSGKNLTQQARYWVFAGFCSGLVALLGYMAALALRLSQRVATAKRANR